MAELCLSLEAYSESVIHHKSSEHIAEMRARGIAYALPDCLKGVVAVFFMGIYPTARLTDARTSNKLSSGKTCRFHAVRIEEVVSPMRSADWQIPQ